ncbi:MAG: serine/threonine-protein kinase [Betaproteobacteria bacterium]
MIETLGRYKILSIIGQGAMGVVYKAVDPMIDRTVAIKTVNLSLNKDELAEYELRFQQEIKAAGRLNHPNIVTIYDVGRNDDMAYMAMEFLEGKELKDILADDGRPLVTASVDWISQIAQGLAFAHDNDIVHRDVKPSNIMIVRGGLAKITDFGIARMPASAVKTMTGLILGSPRYMSPEQVIGRSLDHRTDIFSLGVVLYEALTGLPPFDGDNVNAIMYATVNTAPPAPSNSNATVPTMLDLIVAKALAKTVDERYQTMREFSDDLNQVKRMLVSRQPAGEVVAKHSPPAAKSLSLDALGVGVGLYQKPGVTEETKPLKLARGFDSFDATLKLAAMTNQIGEFGEYISETQKMRAYKGKISGALANDPGSSTQPPSARKGSALPSDATLTNEQMRDAANAGPGIGVPNLLPIVIIILLAALAVGLAVALVVR